MTNQRLALACVVALTFAALLASRTAIAQTADCNALDAKQQKTKTELFASMHPYDGCDETFDRCLAKKPRARVVLRLASDICRRIQADQSKADIERALARRAQSMLPPAKAPSFAIDEATLAGDPRAPVRVVVYACARCPFCKVIVPALYKEVTDGSLKGKVQLHFRPFPIKDHPGSTEGGLAMTSAERLGRFWPMVLMLYHRFDAFCPATLGDWAVEAGIDRAAFDRAMADPNTRAALVASKQEGIRNNVQATPTVFIDGRKYVYNLQTSALVDVMLEAFEAATSAGGP
jgi:protein-disulfide isomerase